MDDRRNFLSLLAAVAAAGTAAAPAEAQAQRQSRTAGVISLPAPYDKQTATFVELFLPPGQPGKPHKHPGFVLGYVIEGEFRYQISGEPERILKPGEIFLEPPGVTHLLGESASKTKPARVLAIVLADAGKPLTEPA